MEIRNVYYKLLKELINTHNFNADKDTILVFKGFNEIFIKCLNDMIPHVSGQLVGGCFDYRSPILNQKKLLASFMSSEGLAWCFYEELIDLSLILADISLIDSEVIIVENNLFEEYFPIKVVADIDYIIQVLNNEKSNDLDEELCRYYSDCKLLNGMLFVSYLNRHYDIDLGRTVSVVGFYKSIIDTNLNSGFIYQNITLNELTQIKVKLQDGDITEKNFIIRDSSIYVKKILPFINTLGKEFDVTFTLVKSERYSEYNKGEEYIGILKNYWGSEANYRSNYFYKDPDISIETIEISQGNIVENVIKQCEIALNQDKGKYSDLIVTAPTGAGKSVLFQIPAIHLHRKYNSITIVICPLLALMYDQVKELHEKGIDYATFINSSITYEERRSRLEGILSGRYSIIYMSPELLLSCDIDSFIGNRKLGLIVVDEAHLVTSWGRDFRVDYWFLGDYLERLRRGSYYSKSENRDVPVLCLTATAVYGGEEDVIGDLKSSLQLVCEDDQTYIGYVKRNNIEFNIRQPKMIRKSAKEENINLTINEIKKSFDDDIKTIMYFPFTSLIDDTINKFTDKHPKYSSYIEKYYSNGLSSLEKNDSYMRFRDNESMVMLATKAFGMGVNISDIEKVYHFAPTGTLSDYVQEIGRSARKLDRGYAVTDFLGSDMSYARTLWGLSGLKHYQLNEMLKKLYELYESKKSRNMLFSPETFNYLFDNKSIDVKVKSGLMLLSSDLYERYHFKVITVRAKNIYTKQFIVVPKEIETSFLEKFGMYCLKMMDLHPSVKKISNGAELTTTKVGDIFEIDLGKLWETEFENDTFAKFKYNFFEGKLFDYGTNRIVPNMKLVIQYFDDYEEAFCKLDTVAEALQKTFNSIKRKFGGRQFNDKAFRDIFCEVYGFNIRREYILMLLDMFCYDHVDLYDTPSECWKFIERRKKDDEAIRSEYSYCIRTNKYGYIKPNLRRYMSQIEPNDREANTFTTYLPISQNVSNGKNEFQFIASLLQLFDIASYELIGGKNPEIFVRINDPLKLQRLANSERKYNNRVLSAIEKRHKRAIVIMNKFLSGNFTSDERWNIIEQYFLGHDKEVERLLSIQHYSGEKEYSDINDNSKKNSYKIIEGEKFSEYYTSWGDASEIEKNVTLTCSDIPIPDYFDSKIQDENVEFNLKYVWNDLKIAVLYDNYDFKVLRYLEEDGWILLNDDCKDISCFKRRLEGDIIV